MTMMRSFNSVHRLTGVSTTAGSLTKNYGYTLNIKDQRIKTTLADGSYWDYAYDNYGQVINAVRKNASGGIAGQSFNYSFDQVGNRQSAFQGTTVSNSQWSYTVNAVNQYSLITEPNGTTYAQVHDADGNLTQYTYDAENRLKTADVGTYCYEYTYDYLSRRIRQKVILKSGATGQMQSEVAYVYDGWNVVGVYATTMATPTFQKGYLWGEELSGSLQGVGRGGGPAGGDARRTDLLPVYDGNGNIMSYLNASTKASVAEYVYDAFGRTISSSGAEADNFTYRFSMKPMDGNGLYYYGYRYYDPQHGRWINRDLLDENGGANLYEMVNNNLIDAFDFLGLFLYAFDGTNNDKDRDQCDNPDALNAPINVAIMYELYTEEKYYKNGVGTRTDIRTGKLFGNGIGERVDDLYNQFLDNYEKDPMHPVDEVPPKVWTIKGYEE